MTQAETHALAAPADIAAMAGFEASAAGVAGALATQAGTASAIAREEGEMKAAIVLARKFPRDEAAAYTKIVKSCQRPAFAEGCTYCFPRGGQKVKGPSIDLAREMARCWGNIRYGLRIVSDDDERVHIKGYAYDLEGNNYVEAEDKFAKLVFRTGKGWIKPDERDLRELVNRRGAICVRNAILQLMPPDIVDDAVRVADETITKAAAGEIKQDRPAALRRLALAFSEIGVNTEMLAEKLGHPLDLITDAELAELRQTWKSIKDGNTKREDHFKMPDANGHSDKAADVNEKVKAIGEPKPTPEEKARKEQAEKLAAAEKQRTETGCAAGLPGCAAEISMVSGKPVCANHAAPSDGALPGMDVPGRGAKKK